MISSANCVVIAIPEDEQHRHHFALTRAVTKLRDDLDQFKAIMTEGGRELTLHDTIMINHDEQAIADLEAMRAALPEPDTFGL